MKWSFLREALIWSMVAVFAVAYLTIGVGIAVAV